MEDHQPKKLHIAVFPWLAFGHIIPFFELSKLIAQKGHKVSFISTPRNIQRLPKLPPTSSQPLLEFTELQLPQVHNLPQDAEATIDIPQNLVPFLKKAFDGLQESLAKFLESSNLDWLIYDYAPYWLPPIASKLKIPCISFCIFSAFGASFILNSLLADLNKSCFDESLNDKVGFTPYEKDKLSREHHETDVSELFRLQETLHGASLIIIRSCLEIDGESLKLINDLSNKPVIPVGLLPPSLQSSGEGSNDENWDTILDWLDKHEKGSVIYIAFGTEVTLSDEEFTEILTGLELSGFPFFWVLKRQNITIESNSVGLSRKNGMIWSKWAPQLKILAHKSIGGFLTHCGWSSVIESLQYGCPLIMLPFQNEQGLVARLMEEKGVGVIVPRNEHDGKFTRESVANALRSVIFEDEGRIYRSQAEEMSKVFGDKELQQKYIDEFVNYMEFHCPKITG